ncbi:MAG: hypothetical protein HND48_13130 [Chloroflexi bacterium]|nr:hypothetical protein [Chloroflexota bacterium]
MANRVMFGAPVRSAVSPWSPSGRSSTAPAILVDRCGVGMYSTEFVKRYSPHVYAHGHRSRARRRGA